jgi:hypothetical protein
MIRGVHTMFYSDRAEELRSFLKEKLKIPCTDIGEGWLIFDFKEADMGVHPTDFPESPRSGTHDISFYCDDLKGTVDELKARGVKFTSEISDQGYAMVTHFEMPGGIKIQLYEPRYKKATTSKRASSKAKKRKAGARKRKAKK